MPISTYLQNTNPQRKLHSRLNTRIQRALARDGIVKAKKTTELIGCSIAEFKNYIESNWEENMSWEKYSLKGWHLDHVRPCATFDLTDVEQQKTCFNWRNILPSWSVDNLSKSHRYTPLDELAWVERMQALGYEGELFLKYEEGNSY